MNIAASDPTTASSLPHPGFGDATHALLARISRAVDCTAFVLLLCAAGTLLFRPADLLPALAGMPLYEFVMTACLVASLPRLWKIIQLRALRSNAIAALTVLLVPAVMLSHLAQMNTYDARLGGLAMAKACIFFILVLALIDSASRLKAMLFSMTAAVLAVTILALLQYHERIDLPALASIVQSASSNDGVAIVRLCGIGVFNDPNDFSMVLVIGAIVCAYGIGAASTPRRRWMWAAPLVLFAYALVLTHSRSGMLSALAALLVFSQARFGWRNTLPLALMLALPLLAYSVWGSRASVDLDDPEDTFQTRLELWNHSLDAFRLDPVFGVGQGKITEVIGQVTHNSYLQAFVEMGLLGGTAFCGAVYLIVQGLWRAAPRDAQLAGLRPCVLAIVISYAAGLCSLSRCYAVPTQLVIGLGAAYLLIIATSGGAAMPRMTLRCAARVTGVGVLFLAATHFFVRMMLTQVQ